MGALICETGLFESVQLVSISGIRPSNGLQCLDMKVHQQWMPTTSLVSRHYNDVTMSAMASQIIDVSIVCSTVSSGTDHRKHQSSPSLDFVRGTTGHKWIPPPPPPPPKGSNADNASIWWRYHKFKVDGNIVLWPTGAMLRGQKLAIIASRNGLVPSQYVDQFGVRNLSGTGLYRQQLHSKNRC